MLTIEFSVPVSDKEWVTSFVIKGEPISKARARFTKRGSKTLTYTPQKTLDGEVAVRAAYLKAVRRICTDIDAAFSVQVHFYSGTRQRRDVDNMSKLILDGLNKTAWPDDNQVVELQARKSFVTQAEARTEVTIFLVGSMGYASRDCRNCGESFRLFPSTSQLQKYCSRECERDYRRKQRTRNCEHCGAVFEAHGSTKQTRFCSKECAYTSKYSLVTCPQCSKEFTRRNSAIRKENYCSYECQNKALHGRRMLTPEFRQGVCSDCGGPTSKKQYKRCQECNMRANTRWANRDDSKECK